jgi:two-component system, OmpR family, osmolarity sensor histidine kinase EnvZ
MKNPLNTLFGRMALLSTVVLLAIQAGWFVLMARQPHHEVDGFARGILFALQAVNSETKHSAELAPALRVHLVPTWNVPSTIHLHPPDARPLAELTEHLRLQLPPGTEFATDDLRPPRLWVHFPGKSMWVIVPVDIPPAPRFLIEGVSMLAAALFLSLAAAWQMQRPLARVADAALAFGAGQRPDAVAQSGPRELRELIASFNDMMRRLNEAGDDQAVMLAGVAHDLKAPLTRLKLRASVLVAEQERAGLIEDIDSLTSIVQQFLEFAGETPETGAPVEVDAFIRKQFCAPEEEVPSDSLLEEQPLFALDLRAGPQFALPRTLLDRLMTNLVDNAFEHGEPPVEITTSREDRQWVINVRDHGPGIPEDRMAAAMKPFVRLDPARGSAGHCGLGLAIVDRLARDRGGRCELGNAPGGGLRVRIAFPTGWALPGRREVSVPAKARAAHADRPAKAGGALTTSYRRT